MSDTFEPVVLLTEYSALTAITPGVDSLWSFESRPGGCDRRSIILNRDRCEYCLDRWDPLLNTILPDQAHMINEFRTFAGSAPMTFFRPHDSTIDPASIQLRGRPTELRHPEPLVAGGQE
jgi:hypothetical protein